ncbi:MAG: TonB-dependent receptor [Bacteroidia bacterium]|nr:TonB-dependent receptor [Bacteroidia bacterium]
MKKYFFLLFTITLLFGPLWSQTEIRGKVFELDQEGLEVELEGATVILVQAKKGTYTDSKGSFKLPWSSGDTLIIRHISYEDDTILIVEGQEYYRTALKTPATQATVEIRAKIPASSYSMIEVQQVQLISRAELGKSACCNLGESFAANGAVDVAATDAATGSREIRLLGLAGRYSQLLTEKKPMTRGLGSIYGLNYISGDWIESIQIAKGTGSVVDGYESMTGQINVEFRKPGCEAPKLHVNLYQNNFGRTEANVIAARQFTERVGTMLYTHGNLNLGHQDPDGDHFLNNPNGKAAILANRWFIQATDQLELQAGIQYLREDRFGGQPEFDPSTDRGSNSVWGLGVKTKQYSAWTKTGYVAKNREFRSAGLILSAFRHDMDSYFGLNDYKGLQDNFRASFTFQDYMVDTRHTIRTGASFLLDRFEETLEDSSFSRMETVPGVFAEYTWKPNDKFSSVIGMRVDQHNMYGTLLTPRLHLRYNPVEKTSLRISAGKGYRTANPIAENIAVLASSRTIVAQQSSLQEKAWTFGAGIVQQFKVKGREGSLVLDAYRTQFTSRLVADVEDPRSLRFYNIQGGSYSNVIQLELNVEVLPRLDVRLAWRSQDVRSTFDSVLKQMPLTPSHAGLINVGWKNKTERWLADVTFAYTGSQRLPSTSDNPTGYQAGERAPAYPRLNAQVTRKFGKTFELYLGGENLTNYRQENPVIGSHDPFGPYFDASIAWGPLMGAMGYIGLRFDIQ